MLRATARIPFGSVSSYREVAAEAGSPNAYRAAGNALGSNPMPIVVPCHRVLHAGGGLGGYTGGLDRKRFLLRLEGVSRPRRGDAGTAQRPTRRRRMKRLTTLTLLAVLLEHAPPTPVAPRR